MMRFLHAADIHLDSPLAGLRARAGARGDTIAGATRDTFVRLIDTALELQVAFLIIAGDVYDGDWKDYATPLFLGAQLARLERAGIPVFLLKGNHDAENVMTRRLTLPANVTVFDARRPQTVRLAELGVALHGQSFASRDVTDNLARGYPPPVAGLLNIGVLHTALDGRVGHAPYAPCTLADLVRHGYDYWALGHVHERAVLHEDPWVVFPGNLQARHANEAGPKGATLVTVAQGRIARVEPLILDTVRWARLDCDVAGCDRFDDLSGRLAEALAGAAAAAEGRPLAIRVRLVGLTALHRSLKSDPARLAAEIEAAAARLAADIWIEKIGVETGDLLPPPAGDADAVGALVNTIAALAADPAERERLADELRPLLGRLPSDLLRSEPFADADAWLGAVMADAEALLLDRLLPAERDR